MKKNTSFYTAKAENRFFPEAVEFVKTAYRLYFKTNRVKPLKKIQIAGTNGKGSTAAMLSSILMCAGYKVGLNISPSLVRVNERISINGEQISDETLERYIPALTAAQESIGRTFGGFERVTAASYLYFIENEVDFAVMETGLGGRFDTVSAVDSCILASIASIGMDHMAMLGSTIPEIAMEKCGIMRRNVPTVTHAQVPEAMQVIDVEAKMLHSKLILTSECEAYCTVSDISGQTLFLSARGEKYAARLNLAGDFQQENAKNALMCALTLQDMGYHIDNKAIEDGFYRTVWHGRLEKTRVAGINSEVIVDGSHNPHAMKSFVASISSLFPNEKFCILLSVMHDKDIGGILDELKAIADIVVCTKTIARSCEPNELANKVHAHGMTSFAANNVEEGLRLCDVMCENGVILCVGSLYLVGAILALNQQ